MQKPSAGPNTGPWTRSVQELFRSVNYCTHQWSGCRHLLVARVKELLREPEVIVWRLVIPPLLALVLGVAYRGDPAGIASVTCIARSGAGHALSLRYIDFLIPGLLGMSLMNSAMWGIGFAFVEMRQRKLLKRYLATPMCRSHFVLALASSRVLLILLEISLLLAVGMLLFHIKVLGSFAQVALVSTVGGVAFSAVGFLIAGRANSVEAAGGRINLSILPMWVFSGVFFPHERFPTVVQPLIKLLPLTALIDALRATILEGAPLGALTGRLSVLALWGGVSFFLALRRFRWN